MGTVVVAVLYSGRTAKWLSSLVFIPTIPSLRAYIRDDCNAIQTVSPDQARFHASLYPVCVLGALTYQYRSHHGYDRACLDVPMGSVGQSRSNKRRGGSTLRLVRLRHLLPLTPCSRWSKNLVVDLPELPKSAYLV